MAKDLRCLLSFHKMKLMTNDDGTPYRACARCGKLDEEYFPPGSGASVG